MANDAYGDNVWELELPEVGDGIRGRRLVREEGRPLSGAVWELPPGCAGVDYHFHHGTSPWDATSVSASGKTLLSLTLR